MELGDPWAFYKQFYSAHGLDHLCTLIPAKTTVMLGTALTMPMVLDNPTDAPLNVTFTIKAADGCTVTPVPPASVAPHTRYYLRMQATGPATVVPDWHQFAVTAVSNGKIIGSVPLQVEMRTWALPQ